MGIVQKIAKGVVVIGVIPALAYTGLMVALRTDMIGFRTVFEQLALAVPALGVGGIALILAGVALLVMRAPMSGLIGLFVGLVSIAMAAGPIEMRKQAGLVPAIHDITTDTENPPQFIQTAALRTADENPAAYDRDQTAQQRDAYPDLRPIYLAASPDAAFNACLTAAKQQGLTIVAQDMATGHIEASATTLWFGFVDDVVFRIAASSEGGAVVDIRSKSRVGMSDVGANAARIRQLRDRIEVAIGAAE